MSHTRFALGFSRNRKVNQLSDAAFRLWTYAMDHAREQLRDGALDEADLDLIPKCPIKGKRRTELVSELVRTGLWEERGDGWQIHDFLDWQDSAEVVANKLKEARERMKRVRANDKQTRERMKGEVRPGGSPLSSPPVSSDSPEGEPGEPEAAGTEPEDRDRPVPLDLLTRCEVVEIPKQFADKHGVPIEAVRWHIREIQGFWSIGPGAGKRRRNWLQVVRSRLHELAKAGKLDEWPGDKGPGAAEPRDPSAALAALERANALAAAKAKAAATEPATAPQGPLAGMVARLTGGAPS